VGSGRLVKLGRSGIGCRPMQIITIAAKGATGLLARRPDVLRP
jgi:hypothetical protein